jgi:hypothetical protein
VVEKVRSVIAPQRTHYYVASGETLTGRFPLLSEEGWLRHQEKSPFRSAADGVVKKKMVEVDHHPVCAE